MTRAKSSRNLAQVEVLHEGNPAQMAFWESPAKFRLFTGGVGSGKTRAGAVEVLRQPAKSIGMVVGPNFPQLRDSTLLTCKELWWDAIEPGSWRTSPYPECVLRNGTRVLFRSGDDPDSLRGPNLGWFWLDEAALMKELMFDIMVGRLRLAPGRGWITTTPKGLNWLHKTFVINADANYAMFRCSTKLNRIFLPASYIETMDRRYSGTFKAQEIEGEFVEWVDEPVYLGFDRPRNVASELLQEYRARLPLRLCCDFNVRIMAWQVVQVIDERPYVLCEIAQSYPTDVRKMTREFRSLFPDHQGGIWIYGDASGRNRTSQTGESDYDLMLEELANYPSEVELLVPRSNPAPRDRINAVNRLLNPIEGYAPLLIDSSCEWLLRDLYQCRWNKTGTDVEKVTDPEDEKALLTHASDGLGYFVVMEYPVDDELPRIKIEQREHEQFRSRVQQQRVDPVFTQDLYRDIEPLGDLPY